jgi:hypothetical protein
MYNGNSSAGRVDHNKSKKSIISSLHSVFPV